MSRTSLSARRISKPSVNLLPRRQALRTAAITAAVVETLEKRQLLSVSFTVSPTTQPTAPTDVVLSDINGDGKLDLISAHGDGTVTIQLGNGDGTFADPTTLQDGLSSNAPAEVMVGTFNGHPDLVLQDGTNVSVMLGNGTAIANADTILTLPGGDLPHSLSVADFNGDGKADLAVGDQNGDVLIFLGNGNGSFQAPIVTANVAANAIDGLEDAVFKTGDKADLLIGGADGTVKVILGNGDGNFSVPSTNVYTVPSGLLFRLGRGDFTGDGKTDIVITQQNGTIDVLPGNGNGTFKAKVVTHLGFNVDGFTHVADINGDGKADLLVTELTGNIMAVLLGNGNGTFKPEQSITLSNGPDTLAVGDLTGQGLLDVVTSSTASEALVLLNTSAPGITSSPTATFTVNNGGTFTITTTGTHGTIITSTGTLPSGVTFKNSPTQNGTATISGVPIGTSGGTYHLTLEAASSATSGNDAVQVFTLTVDQPPKFTSTNHFTFATGTAKTFNVTTSGFPAATVTGTGALPTGVTFNSSTFQLEGTPIFGDGGNYVVTLSATNTGSTVTATQTFTVTVDQPPAISSAANATFMATNASTFSITTSAQSFPTPVLTEVGTLPSGIAFKPNANGTAQLIGTATEASNGFYHISIIATNGLTPRAVQLFTLIIESNTVNITSANHATFITGNTGSFLITGVSTPSLAIDEQLGGSPFSVASGSFPSGVSISSTTGLITGVPTIGTGGIYNVTLSAFNGIVTGMHGFTLQVDEPAQFTGPTTSTFSVGTASSVTVNTTGFPLPTITESGTLPPGVTFKNNGGTLGATFSGKPTSAASGNYNVTLTATNQIVPAAVEYFTLTVDAPVKITSAATTTFSVGNPGTFQIQTAGFGGTLSYSSTALPSGLSLSSTTGALTGTPTSAGTFTITLTADNGLSLGTTPQKFTLIVVQD